MKKRIVLLSSIMIIALFFVAGCDKKKEEEKPKKTGGYDYLVLVNKKNKLPDDWEEKVSLVTTKNAWNEKIQIETETFEQYKKLKKALAAEGITIELDSVYRSVKEQQKLWDEWSVEKGIDYVTNYVAVPGYSEHHTGLAVDICLKIDGELVYENDDMLKEEEIFAKIHEKLADYGFILRYLKGKDDFTGYSYEPWHLRYVGSVKVAKEIAEKGITLEEYLDSTKK